MWSFYSLFKKELQGAYRGESSKPEHHVMTMIQLEGALGRFEQATGHDLDPDSPTYIDGLFVTVEAASWPFSSVDSTGLAKLREDVIAWNGVASPAMVEKWGGREAETRLFMLGVLAFRMGDTASLNRILAETAALENLDALTTRYVVHETMRALVALSEGNREDALRILLAISPSIPSTHTINRPLYSQVYGRMMRAELLFSAGRLEDALPIYQSFHTGYHFEDLSADGWAFKRRAEIHDALGQDSLAIHWYERFVTTWRDADQELQHHVDAARARLEELPRVVAE